MTEEEYLSAVKRRCDTYERTVQAIGCLKSALCWDDETRMYREECKFASGRRMTPIDSDDLTPDIVVQFGPEHGLVGEVKLTASSEIDFENAETQIKSYDQDLCGWWTDSETIHDHQVACVVDDAHVGPAMRRFGAGEAFDRAFILLSAAVIRAASEFLKFELRIGMFIEERLATKFDPNTLIPLERVWIIEEKKFCDDPPPCPEYTMYVLWFYYFLTLRGGETRLARHDDVQVEQVRVDALEARDFLHQAFSVCGSADAEPRQPSVPRKDWITEALDHFVAIGRGDADATNPDVFWITYNPAAHATDLDDFARQVYRNCPPEWAQDEPREDPQQSLTLGEN